MKKILILTVALIFVFSGMAFASVVGSKHDLTTGNGRTGSISGSNGSGTTDQVCVFCHHPHRTNASVVASNLLWNRNFGTGGGYTTYAAQIATDTNDTLNTGADAKHTRVCLSCHDSTYAITVVDTAPVAFTSTAYTNATLSGLQADIGGDSNGLQNDHPVDFDYSAVATAASNEFPGVSTSGNVETGTNTWKLYGNTMQCGTCHEPHTKTASAGVQFIRNAATGNSPLQSSQMCRDCHTLH